MATAQSSSTTKVVPAIIVGGGHVGRALQDMGTGNDLLVKRVRILTSPPFPSSSFNPAATLSFFYFFRSNNLHLSPQTHTLIFTTVPSLFLTNPLNYNHSRTATQSYPFFLFRFSTPRTLPSQPPLSPTLPDGEDKETPATAPPNTQQSGRDLRERDIKTETTFYNMRFGVNKKIIGNGGGVGGSTFEDSDRQVPIGPDPLHHHQYKPTP
ncbi:hypothetical protein ACFE04_003096 [Oxalis oulophora]